MRVQFPPEGRRLAVLAASALALVLAVVFASAVIRLGGDAVQGALLAGVRAAHRVSASLAALVVLAIGWLAWRAGRRVAGTAIVLVTAVLSILGAATGTSPPPAAAAGNFLGGLLLASLLAWLLGRLRRRGGAPLMHAAAGVLAAQVALGAWISIFAEELWSPALLAHATLGVGLAAASAWLALRARDYVVLALASAVPVAGFASALLGQPLAASLAHAAAAALLVTAAAYACGRLT